MKAFDFDPYNRWLFCFAHPDDEIAICAFINRLVIAGCAVFCSWTHDNPTREAEARETARKLNIEASHLFFHHAPDGLVAETIPQLLAPFHHMVTIAQPTRLAVCAFEQGHIDHDATNYLANRTFDGPIFEFPLYHPYSRRIQVLNAFPAMTSYERLDLDHREFGLKLEIAKSYRSQNIWSILFWYEVLQACRGRPVELRKREVLRRQMATCYLEPSLPEPLASEVARHPTWLRWKAIVSELEDSSL